MELEKLYQELGITDYNIEIYTQMLAQLQRNRDSLISEINQIVQNESQTDDIHMGNSENA